MRKSRWNIAALAGACSTMGFCVATGQVAAPVAHAPQLETRPDEATREIVRHVDAEAIAVTISTSPK